MTASARRILVAGVGNIFLGDDAFGVDVVRLLSRRRMPKGVRVADFGIRGLDLAYALLERHDLTILIDAAPRGGIPGTLYTIEPEPPEETDGAFETHGLSPEKVLAMARRLGGPLGRVLVVGCEPSPADPGSDPLEFPAGLSEPVARAVEPAAERVLSLIREARRGRLFNSERMAT